MCTKGRIMPYLEILTHSWKLYAYIMNDIDIRSSYFSPCGVTRIYVKMNILDVSKWILRKMSMEDRGRLEKD
jgi:hypothetical protein